MSPAFIQSCQFLIDVLNLMFSLSYIFILSVHLDCLSIDVASLKQLFLNRLSISRIIPLVNALTKMHYFYIDFNKTYGGDEELCSNLNEDVQHITTNKNWFLCIDPKDHSNEYCCQFKWAWWKFWYLVTSHEISIRKD